MTGIRLPRRLRSHGARRDEASAAAPADPLAGALFDFDPDVSITEEQVDSSALTNTGSLATVSDGGFTPLQLDGSGYLSLGSWTKIDHDVDSPWTIYLVYRIGTTDISGSRFPCSVSLASNTAHYGATQFTATDEAQIQTRNSVDAPAVYTTSGLHLAAGTAYVLAYTFQSLNQGRIYAGGVDSGIQSLSGSKDFGIDLVSIGQLPGYPTYRATGRMFRMLIMPGTQDQDVIDQLESDYAAVLPIWSGSDANSVVSYWLASDPLVDQQDGTSWSANGTPSLISRRGAQAYFGDFSTGYTRATSCLATLANTETVTVYCLVEQTGTGTGTQLPSTFYSSGYANAFQTNVSGSTGGFAQARNGVLNDQDNSFAVGTVSVVSAVLRPGGSGAGSYELEVGVGSSLTGSPATSASGYPVNLSQEDSIGDGAGSGTHCDDCFVWARLVVKGEFNSAIPAELIAAAGVSVTGAPAGATFDLDPNVSITEDQTAAIPLTNTGSLTTVSDNGHTPLQLTGANNNLTAAWTEISDYDVDIPYTFYVVYRVDASDVSGQDILFAAEQSVGVYFLAQFLTGPELRIYVTDSGSVDLSTSTWTGSAGNAYVIAYTVYSTTQGRIVEGSSFDTGLTNWNGGTKDVVPAPIQLRIGGTAAFTNRACHGRVFRFMAYPGDVDTSVISYLQSEYSAVL